MDAEASCPVQRDLYAVFRLTQVWGLTPVTFEKLAGVRRMRLAPVTWQYLGFIFMAACNSFLLLNMITTTFKDESLKHRLNYTSLYFHMVVLTIIVTTSASVYGAPMRIRSATIFLNQVHMIKSKIATLLCNGLFETKYGFLTWFITIQTLIVLLISIYNKYMHVNLNVFSHMVIFAYQFAHGFVFLTMLQFLTCAKEVHSALILINQALEEVLHPMPKKEKLKPGTTKSTVRNDFSNPPELTTTADTIHNLALLYGTACEEVKRLNDSYGFPILSAFISCELHFIFIAYSAIEEIITENCDWVAATVKTYRSIIKMFWILVVIEPCHFTSAEMERTGELLNKLNLKYNDKATSMEVQYFIRYFLLNKVEFSPMYMVTLNRPLLASIAARITTYLVLIFQFRNLEFSI